MNESITRRPARRWPLVTGLAILALTLFAIPVAARSDGQSDVSAARIATASFHDFATAQAAGYVGLVADLQGITCIDSSTGAGAMGVHYLNPSLAPELFDATAVASVDAATPELLVYAPGPDGTKRLVALEYLVYAPGPDGTKRLVALEYLALKDNWDANHGGVAPSLFGQTFNSTPAGNRYGLPAFYSLHAWIWDPNPTDLFAPYNPRVTCP